jgi:hypothetical protein
MAGKGERNAGEGSRLLAVLRTPAVSRGLKGILIPLAMAAVGWIILSSLVGTRSGHGYFHDPPRKPGPPKVLAPEDNGFDECRRLTEPLMPEALGHEAEAALHWAGRAAPAALAGEAPEGYVAESQRVVQSIEFDQGAFRRAVEQPYFCTVPLDPRTDRAYLNGFLTAAEYVLTDAALKAPQGDAEGALDRCETIARLGANLPRG